MKKIEIIVTEEDKKILRNEMKKNEKEKVRNRAKVILLRNDGCTEKEILNKTDLSLNTVISYIKDYKKMGINSIYKNNCKGPTSKLEPYSQDIINEFDKNPIKSAKEGCERIYDKFGIKITETPLKNFLKKKNFVIESQKRYQQKQKKKNKNYF